MGVNVSNFISYKYLSRAFQMYRWEETYKALQSNNYADQRDGTFGLAFELNCVAGILIEQRQFEVHLLRL
jgi:hypothetical protein